MEFKVGTRVRIDPFLEETSFSFSVTEEMLSYRGKSGVITDTRQFDRTCYKVSIDGGEYNWDLNWLVLDVLLNKGR